MILHSVSRTRRLGLPGLPSADRLGAALARHLDDDHHWFRDVVVAGPERLDGVLVGPGGAFTLSEAGERGRFARRNGHWYRWNRSTESWIPWEPAPVTRARLAGRRLSLVLEAAALSTGVEAVLVPPHDMNVEVPSGDAIGLVVERDPARIARLATREERLSQSQVDRIVALLDPRQPLPRLAQATPGG